MALGLVVVEGHLAAGEAGPRIVMMIGEDEYHTWETLPAFAEQELKPRGFSIRIIIQDPKNKNDFPGLVDAVRDADLLLLSVRRRSPPRPQLDALRAHLAAGRSLVGIRTTCHAFAVRGADKTALAGQTNLVEWPTFDPEVLGGNYQGHHPAGPITRVEVVGGAERHPILVGLDLERFESAASLYRVRPLAVTATPLLLGRIPDQPPEPVAWTHRYGPRQARVFFTSLGQAGDFANAIFRQLLLNGIGWALLPADAPE
jgi:type 1 glutamine amidotransferase